MRRRDESVHEWQAKLNSHHMSRLPPADALRLGIQLSDGTRLGSARDVPHPRLPEQEPDGPVLVNHGGGGSGGQDLWKLEFNLWLWPLPTPGPLDLIAEWRALGVPECRVTLDGTAMRDAASAVRPLWDD